MNKTPITVLQDVSMKLGTLPVYTEISSVNRTHQNQFVIRVTWRNYTAEGTANNKKEAKQNAAKKMLSLLSLAKEIPEMLLSSVVKPTENITLPKESNTSTIIDHLCSSANDINISDSDIKKELINYVGLLNEHCQQKNCPAPIYKNIATAGPSHLPVFTVSCIVGSVCQEGCASTKKVAKHKAAKKVLEILQSHMPSIIELNTKTSDPVDNLNVKFMELPTDQSKYEKFNTQKVLEVYGELKKVPVLFKPHIKVENYVEVLSNLCHSISVTNKNCLKNMYNIFSLENSNSLKTIICEAFKTNIEEVNFHAVKGKSAVGIRLNTHPPIFQIGIGVTREQAKKSALCKLLEFVFMLLK